MGYSIQAVKGFSWKTGLKVVTAVVILIKIGVLARLLTPTDFGLFSLVMIALGISEATTQTGINVTILQSQKPVSYFLNTAWVIAIIRGMLIGALIALAGVAMRYYFQQPELIPLILLTSLIPVIKGFINPAIISWRKEFAFSYESAYYFSLVVIDAVLAVALGWWLHSVTALLLAIIGTAIFEVVISFLSLKLRPTFTYVSQVGREILNSARWLSLASVMGYLNDNLDDFIIRATTNTYQLGLYHNAYALSHKLNYDVANSVQHGAFPVFTKISGDRQRLTKAFLKTVFVTTALISFASIPLLLFPELIVSLVFGDQWLSIIPLLPWLVLAGIVHSVALICYSLFLTKGAYKILNTHQVTNLILMILLITICARQFGLEGAAVGLVIARVVAFPIVVYGCYKTLTT